MDEPLSRRERRKEMQRSVDRSDLSLFVCICMYFHRSGSLFKVFVFFWLTRLLYVLCVLCCNTIFSHMEPHFWVQLPINVGNKRNLSQFVLKSLRVSNPATRQLFILLCRICLQGATPLLRANFRRKTSCRLRGYSPLLTRTADMVFLSKGAKTDQKCLKID